MSPEHLNIMLSPNAQTFAPVSHMLDLYDDPNSEFVTNSNHRRTVELLVDELVATEIDHEESDSEVEDLSRDTLPCNDHP